MPLISYFFKNDMLAYQKLFLQFCPPPLALPKYTIICKKGSSPGWMYYLLEGITKIYTTNHAGYERIIGYIMHDTIFGMDCLEPNKQSVVSIESLTPVKVLPFTAETLDRMLDVEPKLAISIAQYCSKIIRMLSFDAENQSINDTRTRLANFIYLYINSVGTANQRVNLTQECMASAINASRVQVARIIGQMKDENIVSTASKGLVVIDMEKLRESCQL